MPMIETTASSFGPNQGHPGPDGNIQVILSQYRGRILEIERSKGELESEKRRIDSDRLLLKTKLSEFGVAGSKELTDLLESIKKELSPDFYKLETSMRALDAELYQLRGEKSIWESQITSSKVTILDLKNKGIVYDSTLSFFRDVSEEARKDIVIKIESFVSSALEKIFGSNVLRFKIDMKVKSNVPHAEFTLEDCLTNQTYSVLESFGGGVGDVISIVLRLAILELQDPPNTGPVVLDEVGKFLSGDRQEKLGSFLREWSHQFNRQIILVTHKPHILKHADRVFKVSKDDTQSIVEIVSPEGETSIRTSEVLDKPFDGQEEKKETAT